MDNQKKDFGFVSANSTSKHVNLVAFDNDVPVSVIGRLVYFDLTIGDDTYRAVGTVTSMLTENGMFSQGFEMASARGLSAEIKSNDVRKSDIDIQAVFKRHKNGEWEQYGSALPTSPATRAKVALLDEEVVSEMLRGAQYASVGTFRGLKGVPAPLNVPNFGDKRGSSHMAVLGKSGSGKSYLSSMLLSTFMQYDAHAIMVIDPQGQWSNENGMSVSPQKLAAGLGRKVTVLRISEDVQLPMDEEVLGKMIDKVNLWSRFRRMGKENQNVFSREVAERLASLAYRGKYDVDPRELLSSIFADIAYSQSALSRIYAKGDNQDSFRNELFRLAGIPVMNEDGVEELLTESDLADIESNWNSIMKAFKPLHSLFARTNLEGKKRRSLSGDHGFMTEVFQVRGNNPSTPAPYVVIDMSPNIKLNDKLGLTKDDNLAMQKLLDNDDIKALMLMMLLKEIKKASEVAFSASNGGNLNTQIVFDEAWRFAPEGKASSDEITELATMLEGFALDTRKFGIGWTYILQSPSDLKYGIWRQLTYVVAGYGLVGDDVKKLEALTDDKSQVDLYRQFISPASTGEYPFMLMGPISPLIFSTSPTFFNAFTTVEGFLEANKLWINSITKKRSLPSVTREFMEQPIDRVVNEKAKPKEEDIKSYSVGKTTPNKTKPQVEVKPVVVDSTTDDSDDLNVPF